MCQHWCVLVKTRGGSVSLLRGLTRAEAKEAANRLYQPSGSGWSFVTDSAIDHLEVFHAGPLCPGQDDTNGMPFVKTMSG